MGGQRRDRQSLGVERKGGPASQVQRRQDGQFVDEVSEPQGSTRVNRNGLI